MSKLHIPVVDMKPYIDEGRNGNLIWLACLAGTLWATGLLEFLLQQFYPSNRHSASRPAPGLLDYPLQQSFKLTLCTKTRSSLKMRKETKELYIVSTDCKTRLYRYYTAACFLATSIESHALPLAAGTHGERRTKLALTLSLAVIKGVTFSLTY